MRLRNWWFIGLVLAPLAPLASVHAQTLKPADLVGVWQGDVDDPNQGSGTRHLILRADGLYLRAVFGHNWGGGAELGQWRLIGDTLWLGADPLLQKWGNEAMVQPYEVYRDTLQDSLPKLLTAPLIAPAEIGLLVWSKLRWIHKFRATREDNQLSLFNGWDAPTPEEAYQKQ